MIDTRPASPGPLFVALGLALLERDRVDEAFDAFAKALDEPDAEPAAALAGLIDASRRGKRQHDALRICLGRLASGLGDTAALVAGAHTVLSRSLVRLDRDWIEEIWTPRADGLDGTSDVELVFLAARINLYQGRAAEALRRLERVAEQWPHDPRVLEGLGEAQRDMGHSAKAIDTLHAALAAAHAGEHPERTSTIVTKLGQALTADGRYPEALEYLQGDVDPVGPYAYERLLARSQSELALGRRDDAFGSAQAAEELRPAAVHPQLIKAQVLLARGDAEGALQASERALASDPSSGEAVFCKAQALLEGGRDPEQGRRLLRRHAKRAGIRQLPAIFAAAFAARRDDPTAWYVRAELAYARGEFEAGEEAVERALELADRGTPALVAWIRRLRGDLLVAQGREPEAGLTLSEAGDAFLDASLIDHAVDTLTEARTRAPQHQPTLWRLAYALSTCALETENSERRRALLEQSLEMWDEAYAHGPPDGEFIWVHASEAWTLFLLAAHDLKRADELRWRALVHLERSLVLQPWYASGWTLLGRLHAALGNLATAQQAFDHAVELDPEAGDALGERANLLYARPDDEALEEVRAVRARLGSSGGWLAILEVQILAAFGRDAEAEARVDAAPAEGADPLACAFARAHLHRFAGRDEEARAEYAQTRELIARSKLSSEESELALAWIDYQLDAVAEARGVFRKALDGGYGTFDGAVNLAYCDLLEGEIEGAAEWFSQALTMAKTHETLLEARLDLRELALRVKGRSDADAVTAAIERDLAAVETADRDLLTRRGPDAMRQELELAADAGGEGSERWLAAMAGVARDAFVSERMEDACALYERITNSEASAESPRFPEAGGRLIEALRAAGVQQRLQGDVTGVEQIQQRLVALGASRITDARVEVANAMIAAEQTDRAITELTDAATASLEPVDATRVLHRLAEVLAVADRLEDAVAIAEQGRAHSHAARLPESEASFEALLGLCTTDPLDLAGAVGNLRRSLDVAAATGMPDPTMPLAAVIESDPPLIASADRFNTAAEALAVLSAESDEPDKVGALKLLRLSLSRMTYRSLRHRYGHEPESEALMPDPWPILFEGDPSLFPDNELTPGVQRLLAEDIPAMREAIFADTGVMVPGLRIRPSGGLGEGAYRVLLHEIVVARGRTPLGQRFVGDSPPRAGALPGRDPLTDTPGVWLPAESADGLDALGWDVHAFILRHVEALVRAHLDTFFGLPELRILVERNLQAGADDIAALLGDRAVRPVLIATVQQLLREQVPVRDVTSLLRSFADRAEGELVCEARERARRALAYELPGIRDRRSRMAAGLDVERALAERTVVVEGQTVVALPRAQASELRRTVAARLAERQEPVAVVVEDPRVRGALSRLLADHSLPGVPVLSAEELEAVKDGEQPLSPRESAMAT